MKTPSEDLFTLIKSLDTREKGFFKVFSAKKSFNKNELSYLKLFDAIDKLNTYDESVLISNLGKIGFPHHLIKAKKYLTKVIHNSLREYHADISISVELQKLLHLTEVFMKKKLAGMAKKTLLKAEKLALEYEMDDYMVVIYSLKKSILRSTRIIKDMEDYLNSDIRKEKQCLRRIKNTMEFGNLAFQMRLTTGKQSKIKQQELVSKTNFILGSPLLSSSQNAQSFSSLRDYYFIHILRCELLGTFDPASYQRQKEWVNYLELHQTKLEERAHTYLSALISLMVIQVNRGNMEQAEKSYQKTRQFYYSLAPKKRTEALLSEFAKASINYMGIQYEKGNPEKSIKTWDQIKDFVSLPKLDRSFFLMICANLSHIYFAAGNYHEALKWVNKILNFRENNMMDLQAMARIYSLLVHYELGNYDMLGHMARSSRRFLVKHNHNSEFKKTILDFFEKHRYVINSQKRKNSEAFRQLKKQLQMLIKDRKEIHAMEYFDYISWIENKIENSPFILVFT